MRAPARDYQVALPTYQRPATLTTRTLPWLTSGGVDPERITLFLHQRDPHLSAYRDLAHQQRLGLHITTAAGIAAQRGIISQHYPPGTPVVTADDDITALLRATSPKHLEPVTGLDGWFREAFLATAAADLHVWGVSPVDNPYFLRPGRPPSTDLKFVIATVWGCYSRPGHPVHTTTVGAKEDYELSLRAWWWDGGLLRFNDHTPRADHYSLAGGCQETRTPDVSEQATAALLRQWPGLVRRNPRRRGDHAEITLARKPRHAGNPPTAPPPGVP